MRIEIIEDNNKKRKFIEAIDGAFPRGLVSRDNYEEILSKICKHAVFIGQIMKDSLQDTQRCMRII